MTQHKAKKHQSGMGWLYRGYFIDHAMDKNDNETREWRISEKNNTAPGNGYWVVFDQFSTLKRCKEMIDKWEQSKAAEMIEEDIISYSEDWKAMKLFHERRNHNGH